MPKISKTSKTKAKPVKKIKAAPIKKKVVKKTVAAKPKKIVPVKSNRVTVDVISDDIPETAPIFSSWPDFGKKTAEDFHKEPEESNVEIPAKVDPIGDGDFDKQKKFFSDWATQIKPQEGQTKPTLAPKKSIGLYRRQAFFYLGATIILLLAVFYLFFSKLTISVMPQGETINDSLTLSITASGADNTTATTSSEIQFNKTIDGEVKIIDVTAEKIYQTSGEEVLSEDVTGQVTLINKYNKAQPLVINTRLLSPDGKLFRLKEAVNIPAGGSVIANVYADKPSADMAISTPTHFTIPGLWAGIQDRIYGESSQPFNSGSQVKRYIKQSDLDSAKKDIAEVLNLKVKNDLKADGTDKIIVYGDNKDTIITEINAKLGDAKPEFIVKASNKVVVVSFSKEKAASLAEARLSLLVPDDKQLIGFDKNKITYSLESYDINNASAIVKSSFSASMFLKSDSSLLDRKKLIGLNSGQISEYLNSFPEIKSYELKFSPAFIKTAPTLPDRINIQIQNVQ